MLSALLGLGLGQRGRACRGGCVQHQQGACACLSVASEVLASSNLSLLQRESLGLYSLALCCVAQVRFCLAMGGVREVAVFVAFKADMQVALGNFQVS